jgi:spore germination protein
MRFRSLVVGALALAVSAASYGSRISVWVPGWDDAALTSLQLHAGAIQESNPVWYEAAADGSISKTYNAENASWRAAMSGGDIIPTVQNYIDGSFNGKVIDSLIASAASREAHATAIAQLAVTNAFDGMDIDYEDVSTSSRANFTAFVTTLGGKLHAAGKKLSVTVYAKAGDGENWDGPGAQDWTAIGSIADSVKIMAYDYHWSTSDAGALTPLSWLDQVATYAERTIPGAKILMGLPWYGYDWSGTQGATVNYASAMNIAKAHGATIGHDVNGEATFTYNNRTVYFQDAAAYARKVEAIKSKHPSIGGFAHWELGAEDPAIWNVIAGTSSTPPPTPPAVPPVTPPVTPPATPPATPPPTPPSTGGTPAGGTTPATPLAADFAFAGQDVMTVQAGREAFVEYRVIAINGFAAATSVSAEKIGSFDGQISLSTPAVQVGMPVQVHLSVPRTATAGSHSLRIRFVSGSVEHDQIVSVTITAAPPSRNRSAKK